ncbi:cysteine-rich with EGF-like domain protein 2-A [Eupeodes corollae]|uniref:cysteine-rich with EGF-like domain protein 2-A n=1 Tax=Eupeodes corollae TaxID=290404 RepID=UPI002492D88C|nr:cysteine-rich with EGF-like domain protein 2-A [Eupeodes corollae]
MIVDKLYIIICFVFLPKNVRSTTNQESLKTIILPPCKACTVLVNSLANTFETPSSVPAKGAEQEALLENVCSEVDRGQNQCIELRNRLRLDIKEHLAEGSADLFTLLCIDKLKACCAPDHFGPNCEKCQDCHKNGKCKGAGTRKGNGKCSCNPGYTGEQCRECAVSFYAAFKDETKLLCSHCHDACGDEGCTSAGPKGCRSCKTGWRMDPNNGCTDVNECLVTRNICTAKQFCVNNDGSYSCLECDRSCQGCDGDGPDMCKACAEGYTLIEGKCTDDSLEQREQYVNLTRFLTYLGLCIATCVIFQSSTTKAYMVGAAVATYIAASEYWLSTTPAPADIKSQLNSKNLEEMIMKML